MKLYFYNTDERYNNIIEWWMKKEEGRGPYYVQECRDYIRWSFSHEIIPNPITVYTRLAVAASPPPELVKMTFVIITTWINDF